MFYTSKIATSDLVWESIWNPQHSWWHPLGILALEEDLHLRRLMTSHLNSTDFGILFLNEEDGFNVKRKINIQS